MSKTGKVFAIPCDRCLDLANKIKESGSTDAELLDLEKHLRRQTKGFFQICVSPEDYELWPGGEDIRDYTFGGRENPMEVIRL